MDNFNQATEAAVEATQNQDTPQEPKSTLEQQILDLDKVEKFKFGGKEMTREQLKNSMMMHSDYTKKTQSVSEVKKYIDNFHIDLERVIENPNLAGEFKKVYPKEFHRYMDYLVRQDAKPKEQSQGDPELREELNQIKNYMHQEQVKAKEAELDSIFTRLSPKYPDAIEDVVMARAQVLIDQGHEPTNEFWEKLFKSSHEQISKRFEDRKNKTLQDQRAANQRGRGPGIGGGTPGQAPKRLTMKEATEHAIRDLGKK